MDCRQRISGPAPVSPRQLSGWYLYDFSESILIYNGLLYFPRWIVVDSGASNLAYNSVFTVVTILLLISAPVLGILSDIRYGRVAFLRVLNAAMFGSAITIYIASNCQRAAARNTVALCAFGVLLAAHQLNGTFYTALLARVAAECNYSKISATGVAFRRAGSIFGILAILPVASGKIRLIPKGPTGPFVFAALLYSVLMTVSLWLIPDDMPKRPIRPHPFKALYASTFRDMAKLRDNRSLMSFVLAYVLFMDAILTVESNVTLYMDQVMHFNGDARAYLLLTLLVMSALGAKISAVLSANVGLKQALTITLVGWVIVLAVIAGTTSSALFCLLFASSGILHGGILNYARVIFLLLIPKDGRAEHLGIYSTFERCASFTGPLAWGICVSFWQTPGGYRIAVLVMASIIAASVPLARRVALPDVGAESL